MIAALLLAFVSFHTIAMPPDVAFTGAFTLEGYTDDPHRVEPQPVFVAETLRERPSAQVSFVAPVTGECAVLETETVDTTAFIILQTVQATQGARVDEQAVLPTASDLDGDDWQPFVEKRYRIAVMCTGPKDGDPELWSDFYEVAVPAMTQT